MHITEILGSLAGICTVVSFIPQLIKTFISRSAEDVSLLMYIILLLGTSLWTSYGLLIGSKPIILTNLVMLVLIVTIMIMKIVYTKDK